MAIGIAHLGLFVASLAFAGLAEATELLIRVPRPAGYGQPVRLNKAQLLLAWWGDNEEIALAHRYEAGELVVIVPLDRDVWASRGAVQPPDFAYVYLEFVDFVPVQSERFYWIGTNAPTAPPVNWQTVSTVRFRFRGGPPVEIRQGERREVSLAVRRPSAKQVRFVDDAGRPFSGITVDGGMFWSRNNHCGHPSGLRPLFANRRVNADGIVAVPDGDVEYGFEIHGAPHTSIVEPPDGDPSFFTAVIEAHELLVRVRRHKRVPLRVRVSIAGRPAAGVTVTGSLRMMGCGVGIGPLGRTDERGALRVPDFHPEEFEAICIGGLDGGLLWSALPPTRGELRIDLPKGTRIGGPTYCHPPEEKFDPAIPLAASTE